MREIGRGFNRIIRSALAANAETQLSARDGNITDRRRDQRIYNDRETLRRAQAGRAIVGNFQREVIGRVGLRDERTEAERAAVGVEGCIRCAEEQREGQRLRRRVRVRGARGERNGLADVHGVIGDRGERRRRVGWPGERQGNRLRMADQSGGGDDCHARRAGGDAVGRRERQQTRAAGVGIVGERGGDTAWKIAHAQSVGGVQSVGCRHGDQTRAISAAVHGQARGSHC